MPTQSYRKDSFLKKAEKTADKLFLGVNTLPRFKFSVQDEQYTIPTSMAERPDLLADRFYGNSRLWWVFALRNPDELKDPIRDFKAGLEIYLPSEETVKQYLGSGYTSGS